MNWALQETSATSQKIKGHRKEDRGDKERGQRTGGDVRSEVWGEILGKALQRPLTGRCSVEEERDNLEVFYSASCVRTFFFRNPLFCGNF